jgi:KTSC domain
MKRTQIESTAIKSRGYSPRTQRLEVEFTSGAIGHYDNVPPQVYTAFVEAESAGKFHNANLRGKYPYTQTKAPRPKPQQQTRPAPRPQPRLSADGLEADLSAIADFLREQNGGEMPLAALLMEVA